MQAQRFEQPYLKNTSIGYRQRIIELVILGIWISIVVFTVSQHEFWRDEVRALSLAQLAVSPFDLYEIIRQYDGHPFLWYFLLYVGNSIFHTPLVLPVTSILIAFLAVAVFMRCSPFPLWLRTLFIFSAFPLYEYSVMARNYGISMLLLFVSAVLYKNRKSKPLLLAFVLALLANTNIHSAMLVCFIMVLWILDSCVDVHTGSMRKTCSSLFPPIAIVTVGVLLCLLFTWPRPDTMMTSIKGIDGSDVLHAFMNSLVKPYYAFSDLVPLHMPHVFTIILLYLAIFGLFYRLHYVLVALGSLVTLGIFFEIVYRGYYRHQGLFLLFLIFLYWILIDSIKDTKNLRKFSKNMLYVGIYVSLSILIVMNIYKGKHLILKDINREYSSNKSFAQYLHTSEKYKDAILIPEPNYLLESFPYYDSNQIYMSRENRFGSFVSFTNDIDFVLSLPQLVDIAKELQEKYEKTVLIVIGHQEFFYRDRKRVKYSYGNKLQFTWNSEELAAFKRQTFLVKEFTSAFGDESYNVYALK